MLNDDTGATAPLLHALLTCPLEEIARPMDDFDAWRDVWETAGRDWAQPIERCVWAGLRCDRLAWAFFTGYQEAIRRLFPGLPATTICAMAITEAGGNHPREIRTCIVPADRGYRLNGEKRFITGGAHAERLFVAASTGIKDGRNRIRVVQVDRNAAGLTVSAMPPMPFIPEISHGTVLFEDVFVPSEQVVEGDGYTGMIKPFRTIEDLHITGAVLGHLLGAARRFGWPTEIVEQVSILFVAVCALDCQDPTSPATHVAAGGLFRQVDALIAAVDPLLSGADSETARRWARDKPVLKVADKVRKLRLETAWRHYGRLAVNR
jgi:acyl-CoA dehydrogenase